MATASTKTKPKQKPKEQPPGARWGDCLERFRRFQAGEERSMHTLRNYQTDLRAFADWYRTANGKQLETVDQVDGGGARAWKEAMRAAGLKPATVNRRLVALSSFTRWAYHERLILEAVDRPRALKTVPLGHKGLEPKARRDLLKDVEKADPRDRGIVHFLLETGVRVQEFANLVWTDIDCRTSQGKIRVVGKGDKQRWIPVNAKVLAALHELGMEEHHGTDRHVVWGKRGAVKVRAIQAVCEGFGISAHQLRHTFAHNCIKAGMSLPDLQALLGHGSLVTTGRYTTSSMDDLHAAMKLLDDSD